ncbi:MAG TPA: GtrA family protein [Verrucomicrobiae bacterium]
MKTFLLQKKQFLLYCAIGGCGTVLSSITFTLLWKFARWHYQAANAAAYAAGTALSFLLNARWNFRVKDWHLLRFTCFFGVALVGWAVSAGILWLLIGQLGFNEYAAYFSALTVIVILQYNLNRRLTFRRLK